MAKLNADTLDKLSSQTAAAHAKITDVIENAGLKLGAAVGAATAPTVQRFEAVVTGLNEQIGKLRDQGDKRDKRQSEELAQYLATFQQMIQNLAESTTDLKHATPMRELAAQYGAAATATAARAKELPTNHPSQDVQQSAVQTAGIMAMTPGGPRPPPPQQYRGSAPGGRNAGQINSGRYAPRGRVRGPDADGFYNTHVAKHGFDDIDVEGKGILARHGISSEEQFKNEARKRCPVCPDDHPLMPHYLDQCSSMFPFTARCGQVLGAAKAAQLRERALERHAGTIGQLAMHAVACGDEGGAEAIYELMAWCNLGEDEAVDLLFTTPESMSADVAESQ